MSVESAPSISRASRWLIRLTFLAIAVGFVLAVTSLVLGIDNFLSLGLKEFLQTNPLAYDKWHMTDQKILLQQLAFWGAGCSVLLLGLGLFLRNKPALQEVGLGKFAFWLGLIGIAVCVLQVLLNMNVEFVTV